jgi:hypothetical protein
MHRTAAVAIVAAALFLDGCSKVSTTGDFRSYQWGMPIEEVLKQESKESKAVQPGVWRRSIDIEWTPSFETQLVGYPALLRFFANGDLLLGAEYTFPWPAEADTCRGRMTQGGQCSLKSAAYAIEVCDRVGALLSEKYGGAPRWLGGFKKRQMPVAYTPESLNRVTFEAWPRSSWEGERVRIEQGFARGNEQGWRCRVRYFAPKKLQDELFQGVEKAEGDAAKTDL